MPVSKISVLGSRSVNFGRSPVDRPALGVLGNGGPPSTGSPRTLRIRPSAASPTGSGDRAVGVGHLHAAGHAVGGAHRDRAHLVLSDVLLHLAGQPDAAPASLLSSMHERVVDLRQVLGLELHVEHRADHLHHPADIPFSACRTRADSFGCDCE